jgi:hypothetical protein
MTQYWRKNSDNDTYLSKYYKNISSFISHDFIFTKGYMIKKKEAWFKCNDVKNIELVIYHCRQKMEFHIQDYPSTTWPIVWI